MQTRALQFQTDLCALTGTDIANAIDFCGWCRSYTDYVANGGDRPPHKPPTS